MINIIFATEKDTLIKTSSKILLMASFDRCFVGNYEFQVKIKDQDQYIIQFQKNIDDISLVKVVCDKFGSYRSLQKTREVVMLFLDKKGPLRWIEIQRYFKSFGWSQSAIEFHLIRLKELNIIKLNNHMRGEYMLNP